MGEIRITATARPGHAGVRLPDKRILLEGQIATVDDSILGREFPGRSYLAVVPDEPKAEQSSEPEIEAEAEPDAGEEPKPRRRRKKADG